MATSRADGVRVPNVVFTVYSDLRRRRYLPLTGGLAGSELWMAGAVPVAAMHPTLADKPGWTAWTASAVVGTGSGHGGCGRGHRIVRPNDGLHPA
jgi:hypothetical protein